MNYSDTLQQLAGASDVDTLNSLIVDLVPTLIEEQGEQATKEYFHFMMYMNQPLDVRITGILKHLDSKNEPQPHGIVPEPKDRGVVIGWQSLARPAEARYHLFIGVPFLYGIMITVYHDIVKDELRMDSTVGSFARTDFKAMGTNPNDKMKRSCTMRGITEIISNLMKLSDEEPIIPIVRDETRTLKYALKMYHATWVEPQQGGTP